MEAWRGGQGRLGAEAAYLIFISRRLRRYHVSSAAAGFTWLQQFVANGAFGLGSLFNVYAGSASLSALPYHQIL